MKTEYIPGDLVMFKNEVVMINEVDNAACTKDPFIYTTCTNKRKSFYERSSELKPIPLTPEILEKNGLKLIHGAYCHSEEKSIEIRLISQTGYCWDAYTYNYHLRSGINSVSDLQHLLFGLGLDSDMIV